jgi:uncharacterized surface protein with fasciclin (FAS1) repeats
MMTTLRTTLAAAALGLAALATPTPLRAETPVPAKTAKAPGDVIDVAVADGRFTILAKAIQAAGLVDTLKGAGPFTVFAPTDAAFAKLPPGTVEGLLADKEKLTAVLTYHVVAGKLSAADVARARSLKTVQGGSLTVDASKGVKIDSATVIVTDVAASNGVIHAIDAVVLPK